MFSRRISVGVLAGIVGMAMLIATSGPSAAFTLSSPSLEKPFVGAFVEQVGGTGGAIGTVGTDGTAGAGVGFWAGNGRSMVRQ